MKKLVLVLTMIVISTSCTKGEDQCGEVTQVGIKQPNKYWLDLDGSRHWVHRSVWHRVSVGTYFCIEY